MIVGLNRKDDGQFYQELFCRSDDGEKIVVFVPVSNSCPNLEPSDYSSDCQGCEHKEKCELFEPFNIMLGKRLLIAKNDTKP